MQRKIIHVDMDSFYAAVEERENPELRGKPFVVGGSPKGRGVVATASYPARKFGIRSAMSAYQALRRCPNLLFIKPRMELYKEESRKVREIFERYTEKIEPLSLDEAFLDVTGSAQYQGSATYIAESIRDAIRSELSLTASAGVAPNKFLAKVGSDWNKPDGLLVIKPNDIHEFVWNLPIRKIPGVGKVSARKFQLQGVHTCGDLQKFSENELRQQWGKWGVRLFQLCRGFDNREVNTNRIRKSLSAESTFSEDITDLGTIQEHFASVYERFTKRLSKSSVEHPLKSIFVKVKFNDFTATTAEQLFTGNPLTLNEESFHGLLHEAWNRGKKPVRLLGAGVRFRVASKASPLQLALFE